MKLTIDDLRIINDSLNDTLILLQEASFNHPSQYKREDIRQRIDKTMRTKGKLLLMLIDAMEEG